MVGLKATSSFLSSSLRLVQLRTLSSGCFCNWIRLGSPSKRTGTFAILWSDHGFVTASPFFSSFNSLCSYYTFLFSKSYRDCQVTGLF